MSAEPSTDLVALNRIGAHVVEIVLNNPAKLNALSAALRTQLRARLASVAADTSVRVAILKGSGRAFSVGGDLSPDGDIAAQRRPGAEADRTHLLDDEVSVFLAVWRLPVPIIAEVHGYCMGVATIIAACCDIVVCSQDATFGWPRLPLGGGMIGPSWLWHVGIHRAKEMSYRVGSRISGVEAAEIGFANQAVPPHEVQSRTRRLAAEIAMMSRDLLVVKKQALNSTFNELGFERTLTAGATWDALAHTTEVFQDVKQELLGTGMAQTMARWEARMSESLGEVDDAG
jgi:enoyl-CoA hydratase